MKKNKLMSGIIAALIIANSFSPTVYASTDILNAPSVASPQSTISDTGAIADVIQSSLNSGLKEKWSTSDSSVAIVSNGGKVTAVGVGTAFITVTNGEDTASCMIEVGTSSDTTENKNYNYDVDFAVSSDTAPIVEGTTSAGKVKVRYIVPSAGKKSEVTVNAGSKFTLKSGKKGTYKIVSDTLGAIKNANKSQGVSVSKAGKITFNKKASRSYDTEITYTGNGGEKYDVICHVVPISFSNKKITIYSQTTGGHTVDSPTITLQNLNMNNGEWAYTNGAKYNKDGSIKDTKKQYATVSVSSDNQSVTISPVSGKKGTVKLTYTLNGVKYKMSVIIKNK